jgi:hypothetical protein
MVFEPSEGANKPRPPGTSLLKKATKGSRTALVELLQHYMRPMRGYLQRVFRDSSEQADRVVRAFVGSKTIQNALVTQYRQEHGKFRYLLAQGLHNFRLEAGGADPDRLTRLAAEPDVERILQRERKRALNEFDRDWAHDVLVRALAQMRSEFQAGSPAHWDVLYLYHFDAAGPTQQEVAVWLNLRSRSQIPGRLQRAVRYLRDLVRRRLQLEFETNEEVEDALDDLFRLLRAWQPHASLDFAIEV